MPLMRLLAISDQSWAPGAVAVAAVLLTVAASVTFVAAGARAGCPWPATASYPRSSRSPPRRRATTRRRRASRRRRPRRPRRHPGTSGADRGDADAAVRRTPGLRHRYRPRRGGTAAARARQRACAAVVALAVAAVAALSAAYLLAPAVVVAAAVWTHHHRKPIDYRDYPQQWVTPVGNVLDDAHLHPVTERPRIR
ncbi:hypothetical protein NKG94_31045 [Micromonospora sp. M12]